MSGNPESNLRSTSQDDIRFTARSLRPSTSGPTGEAPGINGAPTGDGRAVAKAAVVAAERGRRAGKLVDGAETGWEKASIGGEGTAETEVSVEVVKLVAATG